MMHDFELHEFFHSPKNVLLKALLFQSTFLVSVGIFMATILVCLVGQKFWFAFWEKRWPHKFILNLTDL